MHFTLWLSRSAPTGAHAEITWPDFLRFVASPIVAASKDTLEGWSPVRFAGDRRAAKNVEAVSCIVLDDDSSGLSTEQVAAVYAGVAGVVHTSFSHRPEHPKHRIVLRLSRDVSADEHARVWTWVRDRAAARGHALDEATKDPSRLWYVPAHREGGSYAWAPLEGDELDVDAALVSTPAEAAPPAPAPRTAAPASSEARHSAAAKLLAGAWPATGSRHETKKALAGALWRDGWPEPDALAFLRETYEHLQSADGGQLETVVRSTYERAATHNVTGWATLSTLMDAAVVSAARELLSFDGIKERIAQLGARAEAEHETDAPAPDGLGTITWDAWDLEPEPTKYVIDQIVPEGTVGMIVALGSSLKTWTALSWLVSVVRGEPWLARFAVMQGAAMMIDFESGIHTLRVRLHKLGAAGTKGLGVICYPKRVVSDPNFWIELASVASAKKVRLVVVDSLALGAPGVDENTTAAAAPLAYAARFTEATGATVVFVHHARKDEKGDRRNTVRGSTSIYNSCDWAFTFEDVDRLEGRRRMQMLCIKPYGVEPPPVNIELSVDGRLSWFDDQPTTDVAATVGSAHDPADVQRRIRLAVSSRGSIAGYRALSALIGVPEKATQRAIRLMLETGDLVRDKATQHLYDGARDAQRARIHHVLAEAMAARRCIATTAELARKAAATPGVIQSLLDAGEVVWSAGGSSLTGTGDVLYAERHLMSRPG